MIPFNAYSDLEIRHCSDETASEEITNSISSVESKMINEIVEQQGSYASKMFKLLINCVDIPVIAAKLGVSTEFVRAYMYKHLDRILAKNPDFNIPSASKGNLSEILQLWKHADDVIQKAANGISCREIATQYNIKNIRTVIRFLKLKADAIFAINPKFDITMLQPNQITDVNLTEIDEKNYFYVTIGNKQVSVLRGTQPKTIEILKCLANHENVFDIAEKFGVAASNIYRYRKKHSYTILQINPEYYSKYVYNVGVDSGANVNSCDSVDNGDNVVNVDSKNNVKSGDSVDNKVYVRGAYTMKPRTLKIVECLAAKKSLHDISAEFGIDIHGIYTYKYKYIDLILQMNPNFISDIELEIVCCLANNEEMQAVADKCGMKLNYVVRVWQLYEKTVPTLINLGLLSSPKATVQQSDNVQDATVYDIEALDEQNLWEPVDKQSKYGKIYDLEDLAAQNLWETVDNEQTAIKIQNEIPEAIVKNSNAEAEDMSKNVKGEKYDIVGSLREDIYKMRRQTKSKDKNVRSCLRAANEETLYILKDLINGKSVDFIAFEYGKTRYSINQLKDVYESVLSKYTTTLPVDYKKDNISVADWERLIRKVAHGESFERVSNNFQLDIAVIVKYCRLNAAQILAINPKFDVNTIPDEKQYMSRKEQLKEIIKRIANNENLEDIAKDFKKTYAYIRQLRNEHMDEILQINPHFVKLRKATVKSETAVDDTIPMENTACGDANTDDMQTGLHHIYANEFIDTRASSVNGVTSQEHTDTHKAYDSVGLNKGSARSEIVCDDIKVVGNIDNAIRSDGMSMNRHEQYGHKQGITWTAATISVVIAAVENNINQCMADISEHKLQLQELEEHLNELQNVKAMLETENGGIK